MGEGEGTGERKEGECERGRRRGERKLKGERGEEH